MRILLTGVTGHIGGALQQSLQSIGDVIGAGRTVLDLSRPDTLPDALDTMKPDLIVNPAAYTAVDRAETERELAFAVNATAPEVLARWAANNDVPMVHFSTDYVFDGSGDRPWREDDATGPLSVYGHSKLAGENAIRAVGVSHLIIRTSWVYSDSGHNFLRKIIQLAREDDELRVVSDQFGAPTSSHSIAEIIPKILAGGKAAVISRFASLGGLVHMANSGATSRHGFATAILDGLSRRDLFFAAKTIVPVGTADLPTDAARPLNSRFDMTRLENTLRVRMPHWQSALDEHLNGLTMPKQSVVR